MFLVVLTGRCAFVDDVLCEAWHGMLHTDSMSHELTAEEVETSLGGEDGAKMMEHGLLEKVGDAV